MCGLAREIRTWDINGEQVKTILAAPALIDIDIIDELATTIDASIDQLITLYSY